MSDCKHENFGVNADVCRHQKSDKDPAIVGYSVDVKIVCLDCSLPFAFLGLPAGFNPAGACVSADALEGRFSIAPKGEVISEVEGTRLGYSMRRVA